MNELLQALLGSASQQTTGLGVNNGGVSVGAGFNGHVPSGEDFGQMPQIMKMIESLKASGGSPALGAPEGPGASGPRALGAPEQQFSTGGLDPMPPALGAPEQSQFATGGLEPMPPALGGPEGLPAANLGAPEPMMGAPKLGAPEPMQFGAQPWADPRHPQQQPAIDPRHPPQLGAPSWMTGGLGGGNGSPPAPPAWAMGRTFGGPTGSPGASPYTMTTAAAKKSY